MISFRTPATLGLLVVALFLLSTCGENESPQAPETSDVGTTQPRHPTAASISDGAHGGNKYFYFLPPLAPAPTFAGPFDGQQDPVVEICQLSGDDCLEGAQPVVSFTTQGVQSERVRVDYDDELYIVNWNTKVHKPTANQVYRIRVLISNPAVVSPFELGHADVVAVESEPEANNNDPAEPIPIQIGGTLPIKFRIEGDDRGVVLTPWTVVIDPSALDLTSTRVELANGLLRFRVLGPYPSITVGSVVIGGQQEGFLRRVTGVGLSGDILVLTTEQAALTDAVEHMDFEFSIPLSTSRSSPPSLVPAFVFPFSFGTSFDRILWDRNGLTVSTFDAGRNWHTGINFAGTVDIDWEIDSSTVEKFHLIVQGTATAQATLGFTASGVIVFNHTTSPLRIYRQVHYVPVPLAPLPATLPIPILTTVDVVVPFSANASATVTAVGHVETSATATIGSKYVKQDSCSGSGCWTNIPFLPILQGDAELGWEAEVTASARLGIRPEISMAVLGILGPALNIEPYLQMEGTVDLDECKLKESVNWGYDVGFSYTLGFLSPGAPGNLATFRSDPQSVWDEEVPLSQSCSDVASVTVQPETITVGESRQMQATVRDGSGNILTGRSIDWDIPNLEHRQFATINGTTGVVRGERLGVAEVTATVEGVTGRAQVTVQGRPPVITNVEYPAEVPNDTSPIGLIHFVDPDDDVVRACLETTGTVLGSGCIEAESGTFFNSPAGFIFPCGDPRCGIGPVTITVTLTDSEGNESEPVSVETTYVGSPPVISDVEYPNIVPNNTSPIGLIHFDDPDGDVVRACFQTTNTVLGSGCLDAQTGTFFSSPIGFLFPCNPLCPTGSEILTITVTDSEGHESNSVTIFTTYIDSQAANNLELHGEPRKPSVALPEGDNNLQPAAEPKKPPVVRPAESRVD